MNKKYLFFSFFFLSSIVSGSALAELKIGVVDIARIFEQAPQAQSAQKALDSEFSPREQNLIQLQKDVRAMEERLSRDSMTMNESARSKLERDILAKKRDFGREQDIFREDLNMRRGELLEKLQREMILHIREYAKAAKFDILLADGVIYASEAVDVTEEVLKELKSKK